MGTIRFGMTMSLDGFVNDRNGRVGALYPHFEDLRTSALMRESIDHTGAVVMGRRTYAMADDPDWYAQDYNYEFQVPIFVLTHEIPEKRPLENDKLTFTFVTDGIDSAIRQAKAAAGDKRVEVVGGADTARQLMMAGLVDEIQVGIMPVLLGEGLRLFEHLGDPEIRLEKIEVIETGQRTDLLFRVLSRAGQAQLRDREGTTMTAERRDAQTNDLPTKLARPARRALEGAGYLRLEQLAGLRESEVAKLHGMGPKALTQLRQALAEKGLSFADHP